MRTRVKICGITRRRDALDAVRLGADAIGLVFYPASPRYVSPAQAAEITRQLPPFVGVVGLFVDAEPEAIAEAVAAARLSLIQFHGGESDADCGAHGLPWIKAVRMKADVDLREQAASHAGASALLLDAYREGVPGGTGDTFDWDRVPVDMANRIILAGGLTPANVAEAIRRVRPYAVDVSGGVEVEPGLKDADKITAFMRGVRLGQQ
ncbi:MAG: phosphoribosylanthranilate isomerase [Gammaproteobacteria bacterium]